MRQAYEEAYPPLTDDRSYRFLARETLLEDNVEQHCRLAYIPLSFLHSFIFISAGRKLESCWVFFSKLLASWLHAFKMFFRRSFANDSGALARVSCRRRGWLYDGCAQREPLEENIGLVPQQETRQDHPFCQIRQKSVDWKFETVIRLVRDDSLLLFSRNGRAKLARKLQEFLLKHFQFSVDFVCFYT